MPAWDCHGRRGAVGFAGMADIEHPRLRRLDRSDLRRGEEMLVVLRDPLGISAPAAFPQAAGPVLDMLDGRRNTRQLRQSLVLRGRTDLSLQDLDDLVADLSAAGFLDDDAFRGRWEALRREFIASTVRPAHHAGLVYPDDRETLAAHLHSALPQPADRQVAASPVVGVVVPYQPLHGQVIDVVDATLRGLPRACDLDVIVVLGTCHHPGRLPYAVTGKAYATPLGAVPGASSLVAALERAHPWVRREELRHRTALSTEVAAVLLRHLYGADCPPVLPVLCGPAALLPGDDEIRGDLLLATLEHLVAGKRVLWWASAELGHAGPAFGRPPLGSEGLASLASRDRACLDALVAGRTTELTRRCVTPDEFLGCPSGAAALTALAQVLPLGYQADAVDHRIVQAVGPDPGWIGVAGLRLRS